MPPLFSCALDQSPIPLSELRHEYTAKLVSILASIPRPDIQLVLDPRMSSMLNHVLENGQQVLKDHGVKVLSTMTQVKLDFQCPEVLFILRPSVRSTKQMAAHILQQPSSSGTKSFNFHLVYMTKVTNRLVEEVLEKLELQDRLASVSNVDVGFIPLDADLLSLDHHHCLRECYLEGNKTSLTDVSNALAQIERTFGEFPHIRFKGQLSELVWKSVMSAKVDENRGGSPSKDPTKRCQIDTLVLLDRNVDLVSPFVTPLTYEGLLDECIGINNGYIHTSVKDTGEPGKTLTKALNNPNQPW